MFSVDSFRDIRKFSNMVNVQSKTFEFLNLNRLIGKAECMDDNYVCFLFPKSQNMYENRKNRVQELPLNEKNNYRKTSWVFMCFDEMMMMMMIYN